jgi:NodT family efflux transporter outer membrane factor (OMF) lipoprotein
MPPRASRLCVLLAASALAGCTVGPDYHAPAPRLAAGWTGPATPGAAETGAWWTSLDDPLLDALVDEMLAANPSLREAQARLAEARAQRDAVRGGRLPQAQISATGSQVELSKNGQIPIGNIPGFSREFPLFDLGFDASWELDLWGRKTRQIEVAQARVGQAEMAAQGTRLQLVAELARAYVDLRLAQSEAALAGDALAERRRLADLTALLARAGEASAIEASRASADADNAQAAHANAQAAVRAAALRVAVLAGAAPEAMLPRLEAPAPIPAPPAAIAAGLPSDLLRRRPDIRAAERDLAAATAEAGVATADLFPRLTLSLGLGQQARAVGDLLDGDSTRLQAGGGLAWPLFRGGTTRALLRAANARTDQATARYDAAVIQALADSEAAINRFDRSLAALAASARAASHDSAAFDLAQQRRARGEDDALALARARLALLAARQRAEEARAAATEAAIGVHKALGGGWSGGAG